MKKLTVILGILLSVIMMASCSSQGGLTKQQRADMRNIKKQAKEYKKEGWKAPIGVPSIETQLSEVYRRQAELDDKGFCKYVTGEAMTVGETYDAARFMALNLSKLELAGMIETQIAELIETKLANKELSQKEAASLAESAAASKNLVAQKLGRVIVPVNVYRDLPNGNVEVRVITMYSHDLAMESYKQTMRDDLEKKADELSNQLDRILKF